MLEFFTKFIKPANDQLGRDLGIVHIPVKHEQRTQLVTVYVIKNGKQMKTTELAFYRAIGLNL